MHTEKQAAETWCPMVRHASDDGDMASINRYGHDALLVSYPLHSIDMDKRGAILGWARAAIAKATGEQA